MSFSTSFIPSSWSKWTITACVGYLVLVRLCRWRRYNAIHAKYKGVKLEDLTFQEAQQIMHLSSLWDIPAVNLYALSFALFKTYGIPSMSGLLVKTKELASKELVPKRYADTELLISTWMTCPVAGKFDFVEKSGEEELDPRAMIALARVNWLHSKYKISNDEFLYTLSLFVLEPQTWAAKYGWRPLSPLECRALYVFWKEIGTRMNIKDIPGTLDELRSWSLTYEKEYMVPSTTNHDVAMYTMDELLHAVPKTFGIKAFAVKVAICILEERVRIAMILPAQPRWLQLLTHTVLQAARYTQGYLLLPRRHPWLIINPEMPKTAPGEIPRMHPNKWQSKPWYKPQGKGFGALIDRLSVMVGLYDYLPGPNFKSEGFRLEEMGPKAFEKVGHDEVMRRAGEMLGCPVTGPWSLDGRQ